MILVNCGDSSFPGCYFFILHICKGLHVTWTAVYSAWKPVMVDHIYNTVMYEADTEGCHEFWVNKVSSRPVRETLGKSMAEQGWEWCVEHE